MEKIDIITVTQDNVEKYGVCCIKNKKSEGFLAKDEWIKSDFNKTFTIKMAVDKTGDRVGFIEYIDSENAWRPVKADNFLFIHCIAVYSKDMRNEGIAGMLIDYCIHDALKKEKAGVFVMVSEGTWMAGRKVFVNNGFNICAKKGRFELLVRKFTNTTPDPIFIDWEKNLYQYQGWHLIYSNQCPWHIKSVNDISAAATQAGISLHITCLETPQQAQQSPSGYGTFALIKDGKLLEDHYISQTRFRSIIKSID